MHSSVYCNILPSVSEGLNKPFLSKSSFSSFSAQCEAGTFSNSGVGDCELCPIDEYQPNVGQTSCKVCPDGKATIDVGTKFLSECVGKD